MAGKLTGTVIIRMDGVSLRSKDKATLMIGGQERTTQYADHGVAGFTEKPVAAKITCTTIHDSTVDLIKIGNATNVSLEFETDSGVAYLVSNAHCCKPPELSGGDGDVSLEFEGNAAVQR